MDVWDGESDPVVYNGHTETGRLDFNDVIKTISEHGIYMVASDLERHSACLSIVLNGNING